MDTERQTGRTTALLRAALKQSDTSQVVYIAYAHQHQRYCTAIVRRLLNEQGRSDWPATLRIHTVEGWEPWKCKPLTLYVDHSVRTPIDLRLAYTLHSRRYE